jgi:hypothetical protein
MADLPGLEALDLERLSQRLWNIVATQQLSEK